MTPKYKRVLLKISGEALAGPKGFGIDQEILERITDELIEVVGMGVQLGVVVGGGNFWRGQSGENQGMDRVTADHMGMLATTMNALALQDTLERKGVETRVQSAIDMHEIAEPFISRRAVRHLELDRVVIFASGTGCPYFSTDTAAVLRAAEIEAEIVLLAKNIDGVYNADPRKVMDAVKFRSLSFQEVIERKLRATDLTAMTLCSECTIPMLLFSLDERQSIKRAICGENVGTVLQG